MILSNAGIKIALANGTIGINPPPTDERIETSSVDLTLSDIFKIWKPEPFIAKGAKVELNLMDVDYIGVANGYQTKPPTDSDGCLLIPPFRDHPWHFLAQTREKITLRSCLEITLPNVKSFWEGFRSSILHGTDLCED